MGITISTVHDWWTGMQAPICSAHHLRDSKRVSSWTYVRLAAGEFEEPVQLDIWNNSKYRLKLVCSSLAAAVLDSQELPVLTTA